MEFLFESALEVIIFRHSSTLSGYIWTCLALFAAALSLWRLHFPGSGSGSESKPDPKSPPATSPASAAGDTSSPAIFPPAIFPPAISPLESDSLTKGKLTMYFLADEETGGGNEGGKWVNDEISTSIYFLDCLDWKWRGDLGWYSYQDRSAINGGVVKLWDSSRRRRIHGIS